MKWLVAGAVVVSAFTWAVRARRGRRADRRSAGSARRWATRVGAVLAAVLWVLALLALSRAL